MEPEDFKEDSKRPLLSPYDPEDNHDFKAQGLALKPVEPLTVTWHDVSLAITTKKGRKEILHHLSGQAKWGTVTAVMGPTGSGKSSLLNALAGRVSYSKGAELTGEVKVNGLQMDQKSFSKVSAYVTQDDSLYSFLTVKETLTLSSHFYLPSSMSNKDKAAYVKDVINALGLAKAVDTIIGDDRVRGVSGGERKRVSVGVELISNPSLLFLDEALSVMGAMRSLARSGRTVISAIHQPRSSIYDMLDVLVLVSEGRTIYAGPTSLASAYFESQGFKCPSNFCPSDYFLDVISMDYRSQELERRTAGRIQDLADAWEARPLKSEDEEDDHMERHSLDELVKDSLLAAGPDGSYQSSWLTQFVMLFKRSFAQTRRNKFALTVKTVTSVFFALVLGAIYSDSGRNGNSHSQRAIQNYIGVTFFVSVNQAFGNIVGVINTFPVEKVTVQKELAGKAYRLSAYYLAKFLSELPFNILGPLLFSTVAYWLVGLRPEATHFLIFIGLCMLEAICAVSLGVVVSAVSPDVPAASALAPPITIVFMLFSGLFINVNSLPDGAKWCPYFSFIKWAFQAFAINQFAGYEFDCEPDSSQVCNGDQVLESYSMTNYSLSECVMALVGITMTFVALGYVLLRLNAKRYLQMATPSQVSIKVDT